MLSYPKPEDDEKAGIPPETPRVLTTGVISTITKDLDASDVLECYSLVRSVPLHGMANSTLHIQKTAIGFRYRPRGGAGLTAVIKKPVEITLEYGPQRTGAGLDHDVAPLVQVEDTSAFLSWDNVGRVYYTTKIVSENYLSSYYMASMTGTVLEQILEKAILFTERRKRYQPFAVYSSATDQLMKSSSSQDFNMFIWQELATLGVEIEPILPPPMYEARLWASSVTKIIAEGKVSLDAAVFYQNIYACLGAIAMNDYSEFEPTAGPTLSPAPTMLPTTIASPESSNGDGDLDGTGDNHDGDDDDDVPDRSRLRKTRILNTANETANVLDNTASNNSTVNISSSTANITEPKELNTKEQTKNVTQALTKSSANSTEDEGVSSANNATKDESMNNFGELDEGGDNAESDADITNESLENQESEGGDNDDDIDQTDTPQSDAADQAGSNENGDDFFMAVNDEGDLQDADGSENKGSNSSNDAVADDTSGEAVDDNSENDIQGNSNYSAIPISPTSSYPPSISSAPTSVPSIEVTSDNPDGGAETAKDLAEEAKKAADEAKNAAQTDVEHKAADAAQAAADAAKKAADATSKAAEQAAMDGLLSGDGDIMTNIISSSCFANPQYGIAALDEFGNLTSQVYLYRDGSLYWKLDLVPPYFTIEKVNRPLPKAADLTTVAGGGDLVDWTLAILVVVLILLGIVVIVQQMNVKLFDKLYYWQRWFFNPTKYDYEGDLHVVLDTNDYGEDGVPISMGGRRTTASRYRDTVDYFPEISANPSSKSLESASTDGSAGDVELCEVNGTSNLRHTDSDPVMSPGLSNRGSDLHHQSVSFDSEGSYSNRRMKNPDLVDLPSLSSKSKIATPVGSSPKSDACDRGAIDEFPVKDLLDRSP